MRIYRRLLRAAAPSLSRQYGAAIEETLDVRWRQARGRQRIRICCREGVALLGLAWAERLGERARRARRQQQVVAGGKARTMDTLGQEMRQAARRLRRSPSFSAATVLTLALAIGANAAIFAVVERVIIRPLPYPESDRLIELDHGSVALKIANGLGNTPGVYFIYKNRSQSIESAALYGLVARTLSDGGDPRRVRAVAATPSLSTVLRTQPSLGRWFTETEGVPGAPVVAVLSDGLWTRQFGRDPSIIGRSIVLDGHPVEVVGVMTPEFAFPDPATELWLPAQMSAAQGFGLFSQPGIARLREGVALETARAELQGLLVGIADAYPDDPRARSNVNTKLTFTGRLLKDATLGNISRTLWLLWAAVGVVLLVAGANIANLFMVRAEVRQREVAIRRALGAARLGLGRYFFTESALLSATGGALGLLIAWVGLRLLVQAGPSTLPRLHEIQMDAIVVGYVFVWVAVSALAFGSLPLWRGVPMTALHESGRGNTLTRHRHQVRHVLLGAQVAMALVLLLASGLMVRSFQNLRAIDLGFNPDSTLAFSINLPPAKYSTVETMIAAHTTIIDRVAVLPGVASVSATTCLPLSMGCSGNTIVVEGEVYPPGTLPPTSLVRAVGGGYFETMGMRILRGRGIERGDVDRKEPVAVISQAMARRVFNDRDPIGLRLAPNQPPAPDGTRRLEWLTVVGVVSDTPIQRDLPESQPSAMLFMPMPFAVTGTRIGPSASIMNFVVRTSASPESLTAPVREAIRSLDADLAVAQLNTLQAMVDRASARMSFTMVLLAIAALSALALGVVGIYGVTAYIVTQRTSEIGIRLALGAEPTGITSQIVMKGGFVALIGIAVGLAAALAGGQLIASVLYGVSPRDPAVFASTAIALQAIALLACWLPARRASQLNPTIALRAE
jgi:putative ABC transport system permease protein